MLSTENEAAILRQVIQPDVGDISPEAARALLAFQFAESDHARMTELSAKASEGILTASEKDDLEGYINASHFVAFVQAKARASLKNAKPPTVA